MTTPTEYANPPILSGPPKAGKGLIFNPTTGAWDPGSLTGLEAPTAAVREFVTRRDVSLVDFTTTTATAVVSAVDLSEGDLVAHLTFVTGATAGATNTHQWAALLNSAGKVLAVSADGSGALTANAAHAFALGTAYAVTASGIFYAVLGVSGGTQPSVMAKADGTATVAGLAPKVAATVSQTAAPAVGATLTLTAAAHRPYGYTS
jgi:hypothetical protein